MKAFILRPFGKRNGIDFEEVEATLIRPALERLDIAGSGTLTMVEAGNIRVDMFQRLLTADLVIADVSIHNAEVFYELGIRHALRDKRTFLVRCDSHDYPFDVATDRCLVYSRADPAASQPMLIEALRQTMAQETHDSPVFRLLPKLRPPDRSTFLAVPIDFREEADRASAERDIGRLELMAYELERYEWESEGLRVLGQDLALARAHAAAIEVWEKVRQIDPLDLEANQQLATSYQRVGDLERADQAVNRVLTRGGLVPSERAELYSLVARNAKTRWRSEWQDLPPGRRVQSALASRFLQAATEMYEKAFSEDLNHYYSGLNALALLRVTDELVRLNPNDWEVLFDSDSAGRYALEELQGKIDKMSAGVALSLRAAKERVGLSGESSIWIDVTEADLALLVSARPGRVAAAYRNIVNRAPQFVVDAVRGQIDLYFQLGIMRDNVAAALAVLGQAPSDSRLATASEKRGRILLFTGHMIDTPGRPVPRFPASKESVARKAIRDAVAREMTRTDGIAYGLAGAASGGDILFHEVCAELGIPTRVFLAIRRDRYVRASVQPAGREWVSRFYRVLETREPRVLTEAERESDYLPRWLSKKTGYDVWQRSARWMLHTALTEVGRSTTLVALWDGNQGDGPGGTADLVKEATERGVTTIVLDINLLRPEERPREAVAAASHEDPPAPVRVIEPKSRPADEEAFDVFISYNRADQRIVEQIANELVKLGIRPWFDDWQLRPGLPWQDELEKQIEQIKAAAVFVGKEGIGPWQDMEQDAFLREFRKRRCPVIPVVLPDGGDTPKLPIFLTGMTWVDFRRPDPNPMERLVWGITGKRPPAKDDEA